MDASPNGVITLLLHPGHPEHASIDYSLPFSFQTFAVLLAIALVAFILHGGNPGGFWRTRSDVSDEATSLRGSASNSAQLLAIVAVAVCLGIILPWLIAAGAVIHDHNFVVMTVVSLLGMAVVFALLAKYLRRRRPLVVAVLAVVGYYLAYQLAMFISDVGFLPVGGLAAATALAICLPTIPWSAHVVRFLALAGCWAVLWTADAHQWTPDPVMLQFVAWAFGGTAAMIPVLFVACIRWLPAGVRGRWSLERRRTVKRTS
jgi:hypothetical protein